MKDTKASYARHRGVSKAAVTKYARQGRLVWTDDNYIDREATDAAIDGRSSDAGAASAAGAEPAKTAANSAAAPAPEAAPANSLRKLFDNLDLLSKHEAEQVKENYLALQRRLEYERQAGDLVPIDQVEREHADRCQRIRSRLLALPNEAASAIAQRVGGNASEVRSIVQENVNDVLEELAHGHGGSS